MHRLRHGLSRGDARRGNGRIGTRSGRVDIDPGKVAKLAAGDIPFYEPGLRKVLSDNIAAGRLHFTTDYDAAAEFADVHFLGVGTPQKKGEYGADLRHVPLSLTLWCPACGGLL